MLMVKQVEVFPEKRLPLVFLLYPLVSTTATVTTFTPNNVFQGDEVVVEGADQANYNGRFTVTSIDLANNSFTYSMSGTAAGTATGAFTVRRVQRMA